MATQTIYTAKDTRASYNNPDTNYGSDTGLYVDEDLTPDYSFVEFDISSAPASSFVTNVMIHYYCVTSSASASLYFKRSTQAWVENVLTWNNKPTVTGTNMATGSISTSGTWESCDITNLYKDSKDIGSIVSLEIRQSTSLLKVIASREYSSGSYKMYIVITYGGDYYVKVGGNDSSDGLSWSNAWATVNKAATTVSDGSIVHIGFGTYDAEPATNKIAPQNIGSSGIYYLPETATTGGGTGTVSVEQNT